MLREQDLLELRTRELRQSEAFGRTVINSLSAHIAVLDESGVIVAVNEAWRRFARENGGYSERVRIGANYFTACQSAIDSPENEFSTAALQGICAVMNRSQPSFSLEYPCHSATEQRWFCMNVLPLEEKRAWVVVAHENITERRKTEEELRVAMSKAQRHATELAAIMDAVPTAVFVAHDVECRQMSGNRVTQKLLGLPSFSNFSKSAPPEQRPTTFRTMKDGKEIPADQLPVQMAAHGKEIRDYEFDLVFEDGTVHTILGDAVPLLDAEAHPYGAVGAFADITERKRIEGQFRRLIENSHDIIYTITTEGVFIFVSPAWTVLLGYPVSEVLGQSFQEFVHPDDIPSCLQWLQKVIETGQRQADIDYRVCHMDGYWRWFTSSAVPLRDKRRSWENHWLRGYCQGYHRAQTG